MRRLLPTTLLAAASLLGVGEARAQTAAEIVTLLPSEELATGVLVGRVCEDLDGDESCSSSEPGVPRARVLLDDGTFALTDGDGRYHLAGIESRRSELRLPEGGTASVREGFGRRLVKLDLVSLGQRAQVRGSVRRMVEFGPAAAQIVDFAVGFSKAQRTALQPEPRPDAPQADVRRGELRFHVSVRSSPGHLVEVQGQPAPLSATGIAAVEVVVVPGANRVAVSDLAPQGTLTFARQVVDVVPRERGGALFIPRPLQTLATIELPSPSQAPATSVPVVVHAAAGAEVRLGERALAIPASGEARGEVVLSPGPNRIRVELRLPDELQPIGREVEIVASGVSMTAALLGVELAFDRRLRQLNTTGHGTATVQRSFGLLDVCGGLDLESGDILTMFGKNRTATDVEIDADPMAFFRPSDRLAIERVLDPERNPTASGDQGLSGALNPAGFPIWARATHPTYGDLQVGSFHADLTDGEVGRYDRSLFGGRAQGKLPVGSATLSAEAFGAPAFPVGALQPVAAHDEFIGTGGSLVYLRRAFVLPGSEKLRIEVRDGATGLPIEERVLVRHRDYDIDYSTGRILLARPLAMRSAFGPLVTSPLQDDRPRLVADYEHLSVDGSRSRAVGGRAGVAVSGMALHAGGVRESRFGEAADADYQLLGADASVKVGPLSVVAEAAQSLGSMFGPAAASGFGLSDTGGLSFIEAGAAERRRAGALGLRLSLNQEERAAQLWARAREAGFSDSAHASQARSRQFGGSGRWRVGRLEVGALFDDRIAADPRDPFGEFEAHGRDGVLRGAFTLEALTLSAEARYGFLSIAPQFGDAAEAGERFGLGARADYAFTRELSVNVSHQQRLASSGAGPGAADDTFSAVGATYRPRDELGFSVRGGWGPGIGTQVLLGAERAGDEEVAYGSYTVDVDGPDAGRGVAVAGARRRVDGQADVFAEDLFARDIDALRAGRAVGLELRPAKQLRLLGRYERGLRVPFTSERALLRDAGSAQASWLGRGVRLFALAEVRHERGTALNENGVERWQSLGSLAAEAQLARPLTLSGRLNASSTRNRGRREGQFVEGVLGAGLRLERWSALAQYSWVNEFPTSPERLRSLYHLISLRPAAKLGDRVRLGAGLHAAYYPGEQATTIFAGSIRPSLRVVSGLEVAAEAARRSSAAAGESLNAYRAEVGWGFAEIASVAVGYNVYGFSGTGVTPERSSDRVYIRVEAAY